MKNKVFSFLDELDNSDHLFYFFIRKQYFFGLILDLGLPRPASPDGLIQPFFKNLFETFPNRKNSTIMFSYYLESMLETLTIKIEYTSLSSKSYCQAQLSSNSTKLD